MNIYDTLYMMTALEELKPEPTFFKSRYFPTDIEIDVFNTSKVLADYKESDRKAAPFVLPRIGALPVGRGGFSTFELEPGNISISKPLTSAQLMKRGFGESILSTATPEERATRLLMCDLSDLSARISRTEEHLACETMLNNGCIMRHQSDDPDIYEDVPVKFYEGEDNPALFTPQEAWQHSPNEHTPGNWYWDIVEMIKMLTKRGRPATDLLLSNDVGNFLMEDPWGLVLDGGLPAGDLSGGVADLIPGVGEHAAPNAVGRIVQCFSSSGELFDGPGLGDGDAGGIGHGLVVEDLKGVASVGNAVDGVFVLQQSGGQSAVHGLVVVTGSGDVLIQRQSAAVDDTLVNIGVGQVGDVDNFAAGDHGIQVLQVVFVNGGAQFDVLNLDLGVDCVPLLDDLGSLVVLRPAGADPAQGDLLGFSSFRSGLGGSFGSLFGCGCGVFFLLLGSGGLSLVAAGNQTQDHDQSQQKSEHTLHQVCFPSIIDISVYRELPGKRRNGAFPFQGNKDRYLSL